MDIEELLLSSATSLANLIRSKKVSSKELVQAAIHKVKQENSQLNAVIHLREEKALQEADNLTDTGQPFLGVPILIKGLGQTLKGEPDTNGNVLFKDYIAQQTDNFVKSLQNAGFVIIGQTNFPEFGYKNITDSKLYGIAKNPWKQAYAPGGSSGGSAAAVASGWVPLAAGNDGGGSIRIPASWNGLIGLKPTRGRMPVGPSSWRSWQGASINFALTRSAIDTARLLGELQTVQSAAVFQTQLLDSSKFLSSQNPKIKIGYNMESPVGTPVSNEARQAVINAVKFLTDIGYKCEPYNDTINGIDLMNSYYLMNAGETDAMFRNIQAAIKRPVGKKDLELLTWALWQTGKNVSAGEYSNALAIWDQASFKHAELHKKYDLFLTPTCAQAAPKANDPLIQPKYIEKMNHIDELSAKEQRQLIYDQWLQALTYTPFTEQANVTGEPAISLPTHVTEQGLPMGIQFIASKGREDQLLQIAKLFEDHHLLKMLHTTITPN